MKVFYSILNTSIRPIAKEQLSIGLFMSDSIHSYFHYSREKLSLTKKLLSENSYNLLKGYLEGLSVDINSKSGRHDLSSILPEYFNYLSVYNNNLITFSKPLPIDIKLSQNTFEKLFEKFVFNYEKTLIENEFQQVEESPVQYIRKHLYPQIKEHVNLNQLLTPKEIYSLIIPKIKVSFIGRNDMPVAGDTINFEGTSNALTNKLSQFISLIKAFELEKKKGKYYVIGKEPSKKLYPEQHSTWEHLVSSKLIDFVDILEFDSVKNYLSKHSVRPYFNK